MPRLDISFFSKSTKSEGNWVIKAKSKKKAKKKFKELKVAELFDVIDVKRHKKSPGEG